MAINTSVNEFVTDEILTMTELHLTVATGKAFAGAADSFAVTGVSLQCSHRVEVILAHVAAIESREVVRRLSRFAGVQRTGGVRCVGTCVDLFDIHL